MTGRDIRASLLYREAESLYRAVRQPGTGQISDAADVHASPDGRSAVFAASLVDELRGASPTRICRADLSSGELHMLTFGPNVDRLPKYSPDGRYIAFLSDRAREGDFQLYMLDPTAGTVHATPRVEGWVEYLQWSPDGKRILLGVAGHGADISGGQGAVTSKQVTERVPSWMPSVQTGSEEFRWRRAWVYALASDKVVAVSKPGRNVWEAVWSGNEALAAVVSSGPTEGHWYSARLQVINLTTGESREVYTPKDQLGWPAASPSGDHLAVVEAICSDRWVVAGTLLMIDTTSGQVRRVDTRGVDIAHAEWRSEQTLLLAGHRGFQTVVGTYDVGSGVFTETWSSCVISTGGFYANVSGLNGLGDCVLSGRGFTRAPEIAVVRNGEYRVIRSLDVGYGQVARGIESVEALTWGAPDGLEIQGWLLRPKASAPHPLVLNVHGGPVWQWRPLWLSPSYLMLLHHGYALFLTNPRGSSGRGPDFARQIIGDVGGRETYDHLSGIDDLVQRGLADPRRLGVTGGSHGGYMSSWLITQDSRFAAAVPVAPVTNQVSAHMMSNLSDSTGGFLKDRFNNPAGSYFSRSPIMHAHKVKTPTLSICGALDRCTPAVEAVQFHNALLEYGVKSMLVTYPEEGHGVRKFPAAIDCAARVVEWFDEHIPAA